MLRGPLNLIMNTADYLSFTGGTKIINIMIYLHFNSSSSHKEAKWVYKNYILP